jgi:hypothetical protein
LSAIRDRRPLFLPLAHAAAVPMMLTELRLPTIRAQWESALQAIHWRPEGLAVLPKRTTAFSSQSQFTTPPTGQNN